jgi:DNA-binding GntR family transcriptional regulator
VHYVTTYSRAKDDDVELTANSLARSESLRDRTLRVLRQAIVSGEVHPDELYSTTAIARHLGVSVSPVREAMLTLVNEGIMEPVRNRGFRIVRMDSWDMQEVIELRMMIEVPAVSGLAAQDLTAAMPGLRQRVEAMNVAARAGEVTSFLAGDREFHLDLLALHGNRRLVESVAVLRDQTRLYGFAALRDREPLVTAAVEHETILDALELGDASLVKSLMETHLGHVTQEWSGVGSESSRQPEAEGA